MTARQHIKAPKNAASLDAAPAELTPEEHARVSGIVGDLVATHTDASMRKDTAKAEFERTLADTETTKLDALRVIAQELPMLDADYWDAYIKPLFSSALTAAGLKMPGPVVSMYKVALLALVNNIEPKEEFSRDVNKFVNKQARAELIDLGLLAENPKGRKQGSTSNKTKSAAQEAAIVLARHGDVQLDKNVVARRAEMLRVLCTAGNWLVLEKQLAHLCKTLKITVGA